MVMHSQQNTSFSWDALDGIAKTINLIRPWVRSVFYVLCDGVGDTEMISSKDMDVTLSQRERSQETVSHGFSWWLPYCTQFLLERQKASSQFFRHGHPADVVFENAWSNSTTLRITTKSIWCDDRKESTFQVEIWVFIELVCAIMSLAASSYLSLFWCFPMRYVSGD